MKKSKTVRIPEETIKAVQIAATKEGRSFSNMLTRILEQWSESKQSTSKA
jgi:predicted DNA binding CopG/RHH family protein